MPNIASLQLPKLNFSLDALEPYISSKVMDLHYNKHHQGYLNKLKKGLKDTPYEKESLSSLFTKFDNLPSNIQLIIERHGGGYWNHTFFWQILSPQSSPSFFAENVISKFFGSFAQFKKNFETEGLSVFGSGWVWLVINNNKTLEIVSTPNQQNPLMLNLGEPVFGVDLWEHAYYLDYFNERARYLSSLWNIVNWKKVEELLNPLK